MSVQTHTFEDTGEAYDASQCNDNIKNGDVLICTEDRVVGILMEAWPVAVTIERGHFHTLAEGSSWSHIRQTPEYQGDEHFKDYSESETLAHKIRQERGWL